MKILLKNGVKINQANSNGDTALHVAVKKYRVNAVKILLKNNPNVHLTNKKDETVIIIAQKKINVLTSLTNEKIVKDLMDKDKLVNMENIFILLTNVIDSLAIFRFNF